MGDRDRRDGEPGLVGDDDLTIGLDEEHDHEGFRPPTISGYRTISLLGKGGMGRVYLAEDLFLDRLVAIKVISEAFPPEEEPVAFFQREARSMAAIEHPNIVHIYAFGIDDGRPYFVMQFIEGETLGSKIGPDQPWPLPDVVKTSLQIVDALGAAWQQRIVHRDLKPANVLIDHNGNAHVADFGLAMAVRSSFAAGTSPMTGRFVGTPRYVAPEQAKGQEVDYRADFYSLGLMLYEMFVGEAPFEGDTPFDMMTKRFSEKAPSVRERRPDLPFEIDRVITWLTARDRESRPISHESLYARLAELKTARPPSEGRESPPVAIRRPKPESAFRVTNRKPHGDHPDVESRTTRRSPAESKLIGREWELDRLGLRILEALNGKGSIISIVGPAGIGKSRLLSELRSEYSGRNITFLEGRASAMGDTLSFHPLTDILKNWSNITDYDSNADAIHKLETAIETVGDSKILDTFPFLATLMGLKLSGQPAERIARIEDHNLRQLIFNSLRNLVVAAAKTRPLVLAFEDLHWADQTSLEFLESLYGLAMNHDILFINIFRPGFDDTTGRVSAVLKDTYGPYYDELLLQPLTPSDCEQLLCNVIGSPDLPISVKQPIIEKCDGNPYFLEEIAHSILDEGSVRVEQGQLTNLRPIEDLEVPETVQEVLRSRIDRLDQPTREVIRIASVVGRTFLYSVVAEVSGTGQELENRLLFLEGLGMIRRSEQLGQLSFTFNHALMQDVVYGSIDGETKRNVHLRIARSIQNLFSDREHEFFGMLAYHYCAAEDAKKSEEYLVKAGKMAQRSAASSEALRFFRLALDLYSSRNRVKTDSLVMAKLNKNVALALYNHGSYAESITVFRGVLPAYGISPPDTEAGLIAAFIISFLDFIVAVHIPGLRFRRNPRPIDSEGIQLYYKQLSAQAHHDSKRFFLESFVLARRLGMFDLKAVENGVAMYVSAGNLLSWTGVSFNLSKRVLLLIENKVDSNQPKEHISFETANITHGFLAGEWDIATYDHGLVEEALGLGEIFLTSNYVIFHGRTALERGRFDDANRFADELNRIGEEYDHSYPQALQVYLHAKILLKQRRLPDAISDCEAGRRTAEIAALDTVLYGLASLKARALAFMGELDDADKLLQVTARTFDPTRLPKSYRGDYLISRCTVDVMRLERSVLHGPRDELKRDLKSARRSSRRLIRNSKKVASHRVESHRLAGLVEWLDGRQRRAIRQWQEGVVIGEDLGADLDLARLCFEIGARLRSQDRGSPTLIGRKAGDYLNRSRLMFIEMGLDWDLAEMDCLGH